MASTSPARIDDDLYASAKLAGTVQSRSASQQVVHWARIGREIEGSTSISLKEIGEVLAGARSYDSLGSKEQAVVRAAWVARMDELRGGLDLVASFREAGHSWVELDADGKVVERGGGRHAAALGRAARSGSPKGAPAGNAKNQVASARRVAAAKGAAKKAASKRARAAG